MARGRAEEAQALTAQVHLDIADLEEEERFASLSDGAWAFIYLLFFLFSM